MPYLDVADLHLYYEELGQPDGQPLALLHGGGGTADDPRRRLGAGATGLC